MSSALEENYFALLLQSTIQVYCYKCSAAQPTLVFEQNITRYTDQTPAEAFDQIHIEKEHLSPSVYLQSLKDASQTTKILKIQLVFMLFNKIQR